MKDLSRQIVVYRMAIIICILFVVASVCDSIINASINVDWKTIDFEAKALIVICIIKSAVVTIMAFLNKTLARIEAGKTPFTDPDTGNTNQFSKQDLPPTPQQPQTGNKLA